MTDAILTEIRDELHNMNDNMAKIVELLAHWTGPDYTYQVPQPGSQGPQGYQDGWLAQSINNLGELAKDLVKGKIRIVDITNQENM